MYPGFAEFLFFANTSHNSLFKPLAAFLQSHYCNNDQDEREMNPVAISIINALNGTA